MQLHVFDFSTGSGLVLPPDVFSDNRRITQFVDSPDFGTGLTNITIIKTISDSVTDLINTLSWIETHMPQLKKLDFTIYLGTCNEALARSYAEWPVNDKKSIWAELSNIQSRVGTVEAYLPRLSSLSIQIVSDSTSTMDTWEQEGKSKYSWQGWSVSMLGSR